MKLEFRADGAISVNNTIRKNQPSTLQKLSKPIEKYQKIC